MDYISVLLDPWCNNYKMDQGLLTAKVINKYTCYNKLNYNK